MPYLHPRNVDHILDVGRKQTPNLYYIEHCTLQDVILVCIVGVAHAEGKAWILMVFPWVYRPSSLFI